MGYELVSRSARNIAGSLLGLGLVAAPLATTLAAEVSVGAGLRTSFMVADLDGGEGKTSSFAVDDARIYLSGKVTDTAGFMFNTNVTSNNFGSDVAVMDAAATFSFSDQFNIWAGRFLTPSDRSNLYGAYYQNSWAFLSDGVQDPYPQHSFGRDEGVMYWGQFGVTKIAAGVFNNYTGANAPLTDGGDLKGAARVQVDLWDPEGGYYQNGSYYGAKDLLAFGLAGQFAGGDSIMSLDALLEKKLTGGGVVTFEAEYYTANRDAGDSDGYYGLAAYMFPQMVGPGKFQLLGKYGTYSPDGGTDGDTLELNVNYIIKDQNLRLQLFYLDTETGGPLLTGEAGKYYGLGLQIQM
jgi:hypothetical protein